MARLNLGYVPVEQLDRKTLEEAFFYVSRVRSEEKNEIKDFMRGMKAGDVMFIELPDFEQCSEEDKVKMLSRYRSYVGNNAKELDWPVLSNGRFCYETAKPQKVNGAWQLWVRRKPGVDNNGRTDINQ